MPNLVNIFAEQEANIIGDDAQPTLTLSNSSVGTALRVRGGGIAPVLDIAPSSASNASVGAVKLAAASLASAPLFDIVNAGGFVSCTSVVLTTVANTDYALRVNIGGAPRWIPLFKDAAIVGGSAF